MFLEWLAGEEVEKADRKDLLNWRWRTLIFSLQTRPWGHRVLSVDIVGFGSRAKLAASQHDRHIRGTDLPTSSVRTRLHILPASPALQPHTQNRLYLRKVDRICVAELTRSTRRKQYTIEELGPSRYLLHEQMCIRRDLEVRLCLIRSPLV